MNIAIKSKKPSRIFALIGFILCLSVWGQVAHAFNPQPDPPGFGMFGIAAEQTARLNVALERSTGIPPFPWKMSLYFLNGEGRVMAQQSFSVDDGKNAYLDYAAPMMPTGQRLRLRPIVIVEPDANGVTPEFNSTVEVIGKASQRSVLVYPGAHNPPDDKVLHNPPGFYDSGIVGITRGQALRLNVVNSADIYNPEGVPPDPYRVTLSFYSKEGRLLAQTTKAIAPGQAALLDINANNFAPNHGSRLEVYAVVNVLPGANGIAPCVMPTIEGFNIEDGKTAFLLPAVRY